MKKQILSLKEVEQITTQHKAYVVCENPECDDMFHTLHPIVALIGGTLPNFFALEGLDEASANDQIDVAKALLTDPNTFDLDESICVVLDDKLQHVITASAFAENIAGDVQAVGNTAVQVDNTEYYKYRDIELDLQKQKQDAEIEVLKAKARMLNAKALMEEYKAQEFKVKYNLG